MRGIKKKQRGCGKPPHSVRANRPKQFAAPLILMLSAVPTPAAACNYPARVTEQEARALLTPRLGDNRDTIILFEGRSPGGGIAATCGLIGVGKRGMPDHFVIKSRNSHPTPTRFLLLKSDPAQGEAFSRAWSDADCDKGPRR